MALPMDIDSPIGGQNGLTGAPRQSAGLASVGKICDLISLYRPTKLFRRDPSASATSKVSGTQSHVLSLDFDNPGDLLVTSESDNSLQIYNLKEGKHQKTCLSQKYGANHAMFTHKDSCIIHSSTKQNHTIRYLSTHDNNYLRYFEGHEKNVTCLSMHPGQDNFISCSEDDTVRIWDAATRNACGKLFLNGGYLASWDPSGNVFAIGSPAAQTILLYDFRNFDKEPFATFDLLPHCHEVSPSSVGKGWNKLEFSNDGKSLLLGTTGPGHFLLDAFDGGLKAFLHRDRGGTRRLGAGDHNTDQVSDLQPSTGDSCFTSDGRYVLSGSRNENVLVWDTLVSAAQDKQLKPIHELECKVGEAAVVAFNPRYNFFATGDKEVVFWVPDMEPA